MKTPEFGLGRIVNVITKANCRNRISLNKRMIIYVMYFMQGTTCSSMPLENIHKNNIWELLAQLVALKLTQHHFHTVEGYSDDSDCKKATIEQKFLITQKHPTEDLHLVFLSVHKYIKTLIIK